MKKYFVLCFFTLLFGCKQDNPVGTEKPVDTKKYVMWSASPRVYIDDSKVHLEWNIFFDDVLRPYEFVNPDIFDIYISKDDMSNFGKPIELKNDESYSYTVDNLQNGAPYFFYMVSKKKGYESLYSDTIMVIPNKRIEFETLLTNETVHTFWNVSVAHQKNKLAYVDGFYYWNGGDNCCMAASILTSTMDGLEKELVAINSYGPCWSPANDKIAFYTDAKPGGWMPDQIELYDCETKSIKQLTDGNDYNVAPVFSPTGDLLLFQSTKNALEKDTTNMLLQPANIWLFNLKTLESVQVTDLSKTSLVSAERPCWIDNDRFLFQGVYAGGKYQLCESSVSTQQINKVFDSKWNDYTPSVSPDQKKIAFISNRSNTNQIWIYFIDSKAYSQVTGYSNNEWFEPTWNNIQWLDNSTIIFAINDHQLVKQRIE